MKIIILSFLLATAAVGGGYVIGEALVVTLKKLASKQSSCVTDSSVADEE